METRNIIAVGRECTTQSSCDEMNGLGHIGPIEDSRGDESMKKRVAGSRFPYAAVKVLGNWMLQHLDHPYPVDEDKTLSEQQNGLSSDQISNWMSNNRRRL
jgi:hypothetical protein